MKSLNLVGRLSLLALTGVISITPISPQSSIVKEELPQMTSYIAEVKWPETDITKDCYDRSYIDYKVFTRIDGEIIETMQREYMPSCKRVVHKI